MKKYFPLTLRQRSAGVSGHRTFLATAFVLCALVAFALYYFWLRPEPVAVEPVAESASVAWNLGIQDNRQMKKDAALLHGGLKTVLEQVQSGDTVTAIPFSTGKAISQKIVNPRADAAAVGQRLAQIKYSAATGRLSKGMRAAYDHYIAHRVPGQGAVFCLVTDGHPYVPAPQREAEMRAIAEVAGLWRAQRDVRVVTIGVVTDERSHWLLHLLHQNIGGTLTLVRAENAVTVQAALNAFKRTVNAARTGSRTKAATPRRRFLSTSVIAVIVIVSLALNGLWKWHTVRRQRAHEAARIKQEREAALAEAAEREAALQRSRPAQGPTVTVEVCAIDDNGTRHSVEPLFTKSFAPLDLQMADGRILFGSGLAASVRLQDPTIQPAHAAIFVNNGTLELEVEPDATVMIFGETIIGPDSRPYHLPALSLTLGRYSINVNRKSEVNSHG